MNAYRKVKRSAVFGDTKRILVGADTIIAYNGQVYGKPIGIESARRMLRNLSGKWHQVITGICLSGPDESGYRIIDTVSAAVSRVRFHQAEVTEIEDYLHSNEWYGKAGAYAIQGRGSAFVAQLDGDFENVVGLPIGLIHGFIEQRYRHCRFL